MAREVDLAVVGAGAAGLLAAAAAKRLGFDVLVLESSGLVGGDTAVGSGRMWLPGTHLATSLGITDTPEAATDYLNAILGTETDASTAARRQAFAQAAPKLARWLAASNLPLLVERGVPDYHPASAGGRPEGRVLATTPTDRKSLGEWAGKLRSRKPADEAGGLTTLLRQFTHSEGYAATGGEALVAELLRRATANGADIWLDTTVEDIVQDGPSGSVTGLLVRKDGDQIEIRTRKGVLLAVGGFAGSQELREEYLPLPTDAAWSQMGQNTGRLLKLAVAAGAGLAAMPDAWWTPVTVIDGKAYSLEIARKAPHSIIVDQAGDRFFDEAAPPSDVVRHLYESGRGVRTIPSYLIMDARHRRSVPLGPWDAGEYPADTDHPDIISARTLTELAVALDIDRAGFLGSIVRFNGFAHKGADEDFHRGESVWDREALTHTRKAKVPSLGKVEKKPFWAVRVFPGDEGTKGGVAIDPDSQVLRPDGSALPGLYACGGAAASIMKGTSPGPGAALSEALIEAYLAVVSMAKPTR